MFRTQKGRKLDGVIHLCCNSVFYISFNLQFHLIFCPSLTLVIKVIFIMMMTMIIIIIVIIIVLGDGGGGGGSSSSRCSSSY